MTINDKKIIYIIAGMILFALFFGFICRVTVLAAAADPATSTEATTTEQHYTDEELDRMLEIGRQWLADNPVPERASSTDASVDYDVNTYMTYPIDERWIEDDTSINQALDDIYRMILSIRNILLCFFLAFVAYWFDKKLHSIINKLFGGR